jgi:hypothetical protein
MSTLLTEDTAERPRLQRPSHVPHEWLRGMPPLLRTRRARREMGGVGSLLSRRHAENVPLAEPTFDLFRDAAWAATRHDPQE